MSHVRGDPKSFANSECIYGYDKRGLDVDRIPNCKKKIDLVQ